MFTLALRYKDGYIDIGDKVSISMPLSEQQIVGTVAGIFRSVWEPYNIHIRLQEMPLHMSIDTSEILSIMCIDK